MEEPASTNPAVVCPRCGTPVRPNTQFCDHCGARVTSPPACTLCGTMLEPNSRFCPSCGTMIGASPDQPRNAGNSSGTPPEPPAEKPGTSKPVAPVTPDKPGAQPDPLNMIPGVETSGSPEKKTPTESSAPVKNPPKRQKRPRITLPPGIRSRLRPPVLWAYYGGALLILIALILIFTGNILLINAGFFSHAESNGTTLPATTTIPVDVPVITPMPVTTTTLVEPTGNISLVPGLVELPPDNLRISLQVERDPRSFVVSVMYMGGKGQFGVRDILVRLTRSDGTVLTDTFRPVQVGSHVELQGTQKVDRVEVTVRYYTGDEYKVVDQVFDYRIRN